MASGMTDVAEAATLDAWFGSTTLGPATWLLALYTASPGETGGGTEASGGNYSRISVTNNSTNFPAASGGSKSNGTAFTSAVSSAAWGNIVAVGFHTAAGDNLRFYADIDVGNQQNINAANQTWSLPIGALTITQT